MKIVKGLFILFLLGGPFFYGYAQEKVQLDSASVQQLPLSETVQPTKNAFNDVGLMVKEVLGQVYFKVEHIPEPQWFEMEPIAEEYVRTLFQARQTPDDDEATRMMQEAQAKFDAAIDAKLTSAQKTKKQQTELRITQERKRQEKLIKASADSLSRVPMKVSAANGSNASSAAIPSQTIIIVEHK